MQTQPAHGNVGLDVRRLQGTSEAIPAAQRHTRPHRKEVLSYWRPLAAPSGISQCRGSPPRAHTKDGKSLAPLDLCPAQTAVQPTNAPFQTSTVEWAEGGRTLRHIVGRGAGPMSPPSGLHGPDYMCQRLRRRGGPRITLEASNVLPSLHMESSSQRCQDDTWEQHLSSETHEDSLFHGPAERRGHCNKTLRWNLNPECSTHFQNFLCVCLLSCSYPPLPQRT